MLLNAIAFAFALGANALLDARTPPASPARHLGRPERRVPAFEPFTDEEIFRRPNV